MAKDFQFSSKDYPNFRVYTVITSRENNMQNMSQHVACTLSHVFLLKTKPVQGLLHTDNVACIVMRVIKKSTALNIILGSVRSVTLWDHFC